MSTSIGGFCYNKIVRLKASQFIGIAVISLAGPKKIGWILDLVISPENGMFLGFLMKTPSFFKTQKIILPQDVLKILKNNLLILDDTKISEPAEIVRIKQVLDRKTKFLGAKVFLESGTYLGRISDFALSSQALQITDFDIKKSFFSPLFNPRAIPLSQIIKITPEGVILSDNLFSKQTKKGAKKTIKKFLIQN